ncbi:MAG: NAD-dependent epimerase/dehydratase family protein [Chloroflexi bacterium]|nr:MAG: NAD-dependent epimerase/dehydratase family protein [Chloroflexota bacterium]
MTRALVIGGAGFIGVAACKELMRRGVETIASGRKERPFGTFTSYVAFDRTDEAQLERALAQTEPDVVLDLACYQPHEVEGVARHFRGERYVFVSTGVYPDLQGKPAREEDFQPLDGDPPPSLDYREGKRWCETVLSRHDEIPWTVIRPPAVFGPADHTLRIAAYIQRVADDPRKDTVHKAYNASFEGQSLRDLIEGIARALGVPARLHPIPFADMPEGASPYGPDPRRGAGYVIDRARRELGFEPSAIEDALAETLAWYRVAKPSHPGYANREKELALARDD